MAWSAGPGAELGPRRRALLLGASSGLLILASPGVLPWAALSLPTGIAGLFAWVLAACRTGPRRKALEWLAGLIYGASLMSWVGYVTPPSVLWIGAGWGLYYVLAGIVLRRLLHHVGLPLAAGLAYTAGEGLRTLLPTPIGISWVRVGHLFADWPALRGAAAWVGVDGLGFLSAALGGLLAMVVLRGPFSLDHSGSRTRIRARKLGLATRWQLIWVLGLAGGLGLLGSRRAGFADGFEDGPRVLLVQPGFIQERKRDLNQGVSLAELFDRQMALSLAGLAREQANGRRVDLVAWGETMFPSDLVGERLRAAVNADSPLEWPSWDPSVLDPGRFLSESAKSERFLIGALRSGKFLEPSGEAASEFLRTRTLSERRLLGRVPLTSGAIIYDVEDGEAEVRRANAVTFWGADGQRRGAAWKRHLVPGAESIWGLESQSWARYLAGLLMPYVPDLRPGVTTGVLEVERPTGGRPWRMGGAVCFDNGFEDVFLEASGDGGVDFMLVVSNEAWYEQSYEFDQMIAMTRLWAVESGRAILRATNSGVSGLWDASGRELARVEVAGVDRAVAGTIAVTVPVPSRESLPLIVSLNPWIKWFFVLAPLLIMVLFNLFVGRRGPRQEPVQLP